MKALPLTFLFLLAGTVILPAQELRAPDTVRRNAPDPERWTEERIARWEDSVKRALYPEPAIGSLPRSERRTVKPLAKTEAEPMAFANGHVPDSHPVDITKDVGAIPMASGTNPAGAKVYSVPIGIAPGRAGFQPQLSVVYNSLAGSGTMGVGWGIGGLSSISRAPRSRYYDNKTQGVDLTKADAFVLDGMRLVKLSETSTQIRYETEQGLIRATAFLSGDVVRYFEVSYPDGNKAVFGYTTNYGNRLNFPITSLTDPRGNTLTYTYSLWQNHYHISTIAYAGGSLTFHYAINTRPDPVIAYEGGWYTKNDRLLQKISCKTGSSTFREYVFAYQAPVRQNVSALAEIGCTASGKSLNPLLFHYGEGSTAHAYTKAETQLWQWYANAQPGQLIVGRGKFDYGTEDDGLYVLPNKNPHWEHYRNRTWFRKAQHRYDNLYSGTEQIFLYAGLDDGFASPMPNLTTEAGFTDLFCANTDGRYEEEVVKVNNTVSGNSDRLQFKVYSVNLYTGLALKHTRVFHFPTVLTDPTGAKSIHPKFHLTGDFNGDGKIEVLSVSCHHPFGWGHVPSRCYLFDLDAGTKLYEGTPFALYKRFLASNMGDPEAAAQDSDRLYALDYDGDGKTDICLINGNGTYIYTFDIVGSSYSVRQVAHYSGLNKPMLDGRQLLLGEFNGDGKPDFLLTPKKHASDWRIFYSRGNGQFDWQSVSITYRAGSSEFLLQDVNSDGLTDVIEKYGSYSFYTYLARPGNGFSSGTHASFTYAGSVLVPTNINSRNYFHQLVALKNGKVERFSFPRNDGREKLLTGAVNSFGVVEKNHYLMLNESGYHYSKGYGAAYPFENFQGPLSVVVGNEQYLNGQLNEQRTYRYENAVVHKQGRGFCGFGRITAFDNIRWRSYVQEYDPYNFGILKTDDAHATKTTNTWSVSTQWNRIAKVRLTAQSVLDRTTNQTVTAAYQHDWYGNVTKETVQYGSGIGRTTDRAYYNSVSGNAYLIGQPLAQTVTNTRSGSSWTDKETWTYNMVRLPVTRTAHTGAGGDQKTGETRWTYDAHGNVLSEKSAPYHLTEFLGNTYTYDPSGLRLATRTNALSQTATYSDYTPYGYPTNIEDHKGRVTSYDYDEWGRLLGVLRPDGLLESTAIAWGGTGLYTVTKATTGQPTFATHSDALDRAVRNGHQRFDGQWQYVDTEYDTYGRIYRMSLPFRGASAAHWNTYSYDSYDRPATLTAASGKTSSWSYSGTATTETRDGMATTRTVDASGALASVADPGGTISYAYRADGQPASITAPGGVVTSFQYDSHGRRTALIDPSAGNRTTAYSYTNAGELAVTETDPESRTSTSVFDRYGRPASVQTQGQGGATTTYAYGADGLLANETSANGTGKLYTYDYLDRLLTEKESVPDGKWLQRTYAYSDGNLSAVQYASQGGTIGTESYVYANGHHTETQLNGTTNIWKLTAENALGQPTAATSGGIARTYTYNAFGMPTGRSAGSLQDFTYSFDAQTGNLLSRKDNTHSKTEAFGYDNLNRLTSAAGQAIAYAPNGNITQMAGVGTMAYGNAAMPYQITLLDPSGSAVPLRPQNVQYTALQRPHHISELAMNAAFTYKADGDRVKMEVGNGPAMVLTRYYIGNRYELDETPGTGTVERLYLGGDAYSAPAVYVKEDGAWKAYYILRDHLGSITQVANADGSLKQELSYDAWGRLRDPATHIAYAPGHEPVLFLGRGYTGHEHLPWFGLVNMNARLYDPALGRFLSPDPYVQMPDFTQNLNRYSYALNNPLVYVDPDGEFIVVPIIVGAIIGAYTGGVMANNGQANPLKWDYSSGRTWGYMAGGAIVGGASGLVGGSIATSGMPFANTAAIAGSSLTNSLGTHIYTGGQTDISVSFGFGSYNFSTGELGYLGKKGNSSMENTGYGLGALANVSDVLIGTRPKGVDLITEHSDATGHSAIVREGTTGGSRGDPDALISVGPDRWNAQGSWHWMKGTNKWPSYSNNAKDHPRWLQNIKVNMNTIEKYSSWLNKLEDSGRLIYSLELSSCVTHTSMALNLSGIFNIGLHPYLLNAQMYLWSNGVRPWTYNSYYLNR